MAPAFIMVLAGLPCCFASGFVGDSPQTKTGPAFWAMFFMMIATAPVGIGTAWLSERMSKARGPRWLWLNTVVAIVYFGTLWLLAHYVIR